MSDALTTWRKRLDYLQQQEAIVADPSQRFTLAEQIKEAQAKIAEMTATAESQGPGQGAFRADISRIVKYAPAELIGREAETELLNDAWARVQNQEPKRPHIAERGPMRLFMADIHLYRARLFHNVARYPWDKSPDGTPRGPKDDLAAARRTRRRRSGSEELVVHLECADLSALWVRGGLSPRCGYGEFNVRRLRQVAAEPKRRQAGALQKRALQNKSTPKNVQSKLQTKV